MSVGPNCFLFFFYSKLFFFIAKADVKNAFRLISIYLDNKDLLGIYWQLFFVLHKVTPQEIRSLMGFLNFPCTVVVLGQASCAG